MNHTIIYSFASTFNISPFFNKEKEGLGVSPGKSGFIEQAYKGGNGDGGSFEACYSSTTFYGETLNLSNLKGTGRTSFLLY